MRKYVLLVFFCSGFYSLFAQNINLVESGRNTSLRGLSVWNDSIAWVSGSGGWLAHTFDGAKSWHWQQLEKYRDFDFRDIEVLSEQRIILLSAGSPAVILLSTDGGGSWKEVYRNDSPGIFLDGMDFRNAKEGIIYGDPIQGKSSTGSFSISFFKNKWGIAAGGDFLSDTSRSNNLLWSRNGGKTWSRPIISTFGYRSAVEHISKKLALASGPYRDGFFERWRENLEKAFWSGFSCPQEG